MELGLFESSMTQLPPCSSPTEMPRFFAVGALGRGVILLAPTDSAVLLAQVINQELTLGLERSMNNPKGSDNLGRFRKHILTSAGDLQPNMGKAKTPLHDQFFLVIVET
jgi:hypothetical protein